MLLCSFACVVIVNTGSAVGLKLLSLTTLVPHYPESSRLICSIFVLFIIFFWRSYLKRGGYPIPPERFCSVISFETT